VKEAQMNPTFPTDDAVVVHDDTLDDVTTARTARTIARLAEEHLWRKQRVRVYRQ
jgi:hypothetical protein